MIHIFICVLENKNILVNDKMCFIYIYLILILNSKNITYMTIFNKYIKSSDSFLLKETFDESLWNLDL